jgi:Glycosyltransferases involved in cell wall biogenesis
MRMTAVVCTRNRGATVTDAVRSILANDHPDFELIVIDQSTDDVTPDVSLRVHGGSQVTIREITGARIKQREKPWYQPGEIEESGDDR